MGSHYRPSPQGEAVNHPWLNKPDTKYNAGGVYKTGLAVDGDEAIAFKTIIDQLCESALVDEKVSFTPSGKPKYTPAQQKALSVYHPYEEELDAEGEPTGRIIFHFKQNATLTLKDQEKKHVNIALRDSNDEPISTPIFAGSVIRIMWKDRKSVITATKQVGIRLDFNMVQLIKPAEGSSKPKTTFGKVEGGYVKPQSDNSAAPFDQDDSDSDSSEY